MLNTYISLGYWGLFNMEQKAQQKQQTNFLESFAVTKYIIITNHAEQENIYHLFPTLSGLQK